MTGKILRADGRASRGRRDKGFTILETAISLIVLMVAGLAAASLFMYATKYNTGAYDRAVSLAIAQRQMEILRRTPFSQIAASAQTVTDAGRPFSVVTRVCNDGTAVCGGSTSVKRVTVEVTPQVGGGAWALSSVKIVTLRSDINTGTYF
jgi:Tfp pilus assembly protein PilV